MVNAADALNLAWAAFGRDKYAQSKREFRSILTLPTLTAADSQQARFGLGYALAFSQQFEEAREIFASLGQQAAAQNDPAFEHVALHQVGMVERMAGNWEAAQDCFQRERGMVARLGNADLAVAVNAYELGTVAQHLGQQAEAKAWLDLSLAHARRTTDLIAVGCAQRGLGDWYSAQGQAEQALSCWRAAQTAFQAAGDDKAASDVERRLNS